MNNQQTKKHSNEHHNHPHAEDDCDGCQNERKQNNMLVDFYQRLSNIEGKVDKIKESLGTQQQQRVMNKLKIDQIASILLTKPQKAIQQIKSHNSKQMGYELASALIQREIKAKLQNQRLQIIIQQLKSDKKKLEEQKQKNFDTNIASNHVQTQSNTPKNNKFYEPLNSRYADSIDKVRRTNSIDSTFFAAKQKEKAVKNSYFPQEDKKKYWSTSEDQVDTSFSNFGSVNKKEKIQNQYVGLNLWLYDFKPQQLDDSPIKSLRKPNKAQKRVQNRNLQSKF